ncbi:hypothetical protein TNCV_1908841 [Trichonephila clavipes]|nr:hypothetical protein TNCV_1908841 [Trichonephila clavipes]
MRVARDREPLAKVKQFHASEPQLQLGLVIRRLTYTHSYTTFKSHRFVFYLSASQLDHSFLASCLVRKLIERNVPLAKQINLKRLMVTARLSESGLQINEQEQPIEELVSLDQCF